MDLCTINLIEGLKRGLLGLKMSDRVEALLPIHIKAILKTYIHAHLYLYYSIMSFMDVLISKYKLSALL
jgi:hypothetical protein